MTDLMRRLSLALLLFLLIAGLAGHLLLSVNNTSHTAREANCPIHSGMVQPEKAQPCTHKPAITIGETKDGTRALSLGAKIPHPPPTNY
jgi:hypothetical protein